MDITNINLGACPLQYLSIGYVGETGARPVAFDFSAWATEYGAGVLQMLLQRPGDADPYPVVLDIDGTTATWTPDATATEKTGQGQAQLIYTVGGVVVKNAIFRVLIAPSLGAAGNPPEPYEDWLERLLTIAAEAQQSTIDAAGSAEAAGTSAGAAAGSAGAAAQSALDAEAAKSGAEAAAAAAGQSAALAGEKAAQAAQSAQTAAQKATDAQTAATAAGASADRAETAAETAEAAADGADQAKTDAQSAASAAAASEASAAASAAVARELIDQIPDIEAEIDKKAPAIYKSIGPAAIASFDDGADDMPVKKIVGTIVPVQSGTGNPSPDNVRPISGWTGVNIYNEETYDASATPKLTVDWQNEAGPIYGGNFTLNEDGSADVVCSYVVYNIQPSQWTWQRSSHCFSINRSALSPRYKVFGNNIDNRIADIVCDKYKPNSFNNIANSVGNPNFSVAIREYNAQWIALRTDGTNSVLPEECQIKLPLAAPITYRISEAGQLKTFLGVNNIWVDAGDVTAVYPADTKTYVDTRAAAISGQIDTLGGEVDTLKDDVDALEGDVADTQNMIATVEPSETASRDYAVGDLLVLGGALYKVTSAITLGSTIIPDGNVEQTTVEAQIAAGGGGAPKNYLKYTQEADATNTSLLQFGDVPLEIFDELTMLIYQSDSAAHGTAWSNNENSCYLTIRDVVNNGYISAVPDSLKGNGPNVIKIRRYPSAIICEVMLNGAAPLLNATVRATDYVDALRWISVSSNNKTIYAGTVVECIVSKFT